MKIESQVCLLEQAKKLKDLGVTQDSQCYWRHGRLEHIEGVNSWHDEQTLKEMIEEYDRSCEPGWRDKFELYSAFTVAELGVMLPKKLNASWKHEDDTGIGGTWESTCHTKVEFGFDDKKGMFIVKYPLLASIGHKKEAIARAEMLISLIEKKLITADEVNQLLKNA